MSEKIVCDLSGQAEDEIQAVCVLKCLDLGD